MNALATAELKVAITIPFGLRLRVEGSWFRAYTSTSLIRKRTPLGTYRGPMPRVLGGSSGGGRFQGRGTPVATPNFKVVDLEIWGEELIRAVADERTKLRQP